MKLDINNYPGSKNGSGVLQWLINHVPDADVHIEMFGGSGKLSFQLAKYVNKMYLLEKSKPVSIQLKNKQNHLYQLADKLTIQNLDSLDFYLEKIAVQYSYENCFFYFDPPYLKEERKSQRNLYDHEWTMNDHIKMFKLIDLLVDQKAFIMVSHYNCRIYNNNFKSWKTSTIKTRTRSHTVEEKIWMNYDIAKMKLACIDYIGKDFTDRQRIKRKQNTFISKLKSLPFHEQQALIEIIQRTF